MFDQTENGRDASVAKQVHEAQGNGSVAEPGGSPAENTLGPSDENAAADADAGFVAGLSSPFEVELRDLQWNAEMRDPDVLESLGASLKVLQINDIIISPKSAAGKHVVIAGNRRCAAAAVAGLTRLRARIYQGNASEIVSIVENAQRLDESPKSLLRRLRKALQAGVDREEVREFLGETGKAKSTISDLLYGARLDEDRYQAVMCSENVFRAIADLRRRKRVPAAAPPVDPPPQATAAGDGQKPQEKRGVEHEIPVASASSVNDVASQPLEEEPASDSTQSESEITEMLPARNGSVAERPVNPVTASRWASWREVESGVTEPPSKAEASVNASQHSEPEGDRMVMDLDLRVALAECAKSDEEKTSAGDWSVAMVRPSGSRDLPVDRGLAQSAIAEIQRRCAGES
jgi:ParB-like nuclease domain